MKTLNNTLKNIKESGKPAFMMHIVAGYPDINSSTQIARTILEAGADILEIQIPFSDPVADGPVIAAANEQSLQRGTTVKRSLDMIEEIAGSTQKPVVIMSYFNIIHHYGVEKFCARVAEIGVQGIIVPDYPYDEEQGNSLLSYCTRYSLAFIQVLASTSKEARMKEISKHATGFVYCVARTGITGKKTIINDDTIQYLKNVRKHSSLPLAVGFGLSERDQIEALEPHAEIMIVGSALIRQYADVPLVVGMEKIKRFISNLINPE